ncbi:38072_t:CDS:2 [Gigaspora margarita]|uniref:38072_t:CDS:1 n=1 Tax=Gigaspora margarita TaxID=4874 RepID=A0ABN7UKA8_GIGMA|nr:38072_t:CDS:2 [Gigaspora margarita]
MADSKKDRDDPDKHNITERQKRYTGGRKIQNTHGTEDIEEYNWVVSTNTNLVRTKAIAVPSVVVVFFGIERKNWTR